MTKRPADIFHRQLAELTEVLHRISADEFETAAAMIADAPAVFLAGRGRNGLALRALGNRLMQLDIPVEVIGDILTGPVKQGDLLVIASSSGSTPALLDAARSALDLGARVLALTAGGGTALARQASVRLAVPAQLSDGGESIQPLGTLFEQALGVVCDALVVGVMDRLGATADNMRARHANIE